MSNYFYLFILLASGLVPISLSFEKRLQFYKNFPKLIPAISIGAIVFIAWDTVFTDAGVWGFNHNYLTGIKIFNLPIEEIAFFFVIPYCCIFLHESFHYLVKFDPFQKYQKLISVILIIFTTSLAWQNTDKVYTFSAMLALSLVVFFSEFISKNQELSKFYLSYLIILIPFSIVNGILTGSFLAEPIVWYNDNANLGLRLGTIPFEDSFYGMALLLLDFNLFKRS